MFVKEVVQFVVARGIIVQATAAIRYLGVFTSICDRHIDLEVCSILKNEGEMVMKGIVKMQCGVSVPVLNVSV